MRMIAVGSAALVEGFALLGMETVADATPEQLQALIGELRGKGVQALLVVEHTLLRRGGETVTEAQCECSHVLIAEVPPLHTPSTHHAPVEELVAQVLGPEALKDRD